MGLLLLYASRPEQFTITEEPEWVRTWLDKRTESAEKKEQKQKEKAEKPVDEAARAKRQAARNTKVAGGIDELQTWMKDILRNGLLNIPERAESLFTPFSRRMIDAQAPGLAAMVIRLAEIKYRTIIPEVRIGYGRKRRAMKDIVLCLDQSGSMGTSVVYSGIFGSVLASIPAVNTRMVVFDTAVVDLTDDLQDPVDLLFGVQLGGGTDIHKALTYCQSVIGRPEDTVLVLVTDLYEGGSEHEMRKKFVSFVNSGVQLVVLPALNDDGAPSFDRDNAQFLAELGVPTFACTPDKFPDLMAAALNKQDIGMWAAKNVNL